MIRHGDCLDVLPTLAAASVDAIVTDPPYGLGFMGKAWDHGVPGVPFWEAMLRVAKPGAYLAAFGGTRTFHRMMVGIEDAGWEIRDTLMWVYGSGFPKSKNLGDGRGTALKPAWEPIVLARAPMTGTVAANVAAHGTGALNIDACRIEAGADYADLQVTQGGRAGGGFNVGSGDGSRRDAFEPATGRWPANLLHDGSPEVLAGFPEEAGGGFGVRGAGAVDGRSSFALGGQGQTVGFGDSGSAARFFYCAKASREDRNHGCDGLPARPLLWSSGEANPGSFQAEGTDRTSRNFHPTVKPTDLMRWLVRLVTPPGGLVLDPFCGSGSTGRGALMEGRQFLGIEREADYVEIATARLRVQTGLAFA